jgi:hypothetical protein
VSIIQSHIPKVGPTVRLSSLASKASTACVRLAGTYQ